MIRILVLLPLAFCLASPIRPRPVQPVVQSGDECPCAIATYGSDTCSCTVQITSYSGFPRTGDCEYDEVGCGLDRFPCEWKGLLTVSCVGATPVVKLFDLQTDCGAFPSYRQINCTGGSGVITLGVECETCK
jgi:hypothetical protein